MKILILSDYDSRWAHNEKVYDTESKTLTDIKIKSAVVEVIELYFYFGTFDREWELYDMEGPVNPDDPYCGIQPNYVEEAKRIVNSYDDVILCQDGDIQTKSTIKPRNS